MIVRVKGREVYCLLGTVLSILDKLIYFNFSLVVFLFINLVGVLFFFDGWGN